MASPSFDLIIPVRTVNDYIRETVEHIRKLDDPDWTLTIVTNDPASSEWDDPRIRLMASGRVGPGAKRDLAARVATAPYLVFLDDDSYPRKDLLTVARPHFQDPEVVALGGPALTPPQNGFFQKVSGAVFLSRFSGGAPERYLPTGGVRDVTDWPSVNLMVRRSAFLEVGGFNTPFWPGEDTKLCWALVKTGQKIRYVPDLIVWHHRRPGFFAHLKQVGAYGLHRGYFVKRYPETSRKLAYFAPAAFVLFVLLSLGMALVGGPAWLKYLLMAGGAVYLLALVKAFFDVRPHVGTAVALVAMVYGVATHLAYGAQFLRGLLFTRNLVSQLR